MARLLALSLLLALPARAADGLRSFKARITFYCPSCRRCGTHGFTASDTRARWGEIAVDPRVIPLGSRVRIAGLGTFTAEDTGGAVRGATVDVCNPHRSHTANHNATRHGVKVTILRRGWGRRGER